MKLNNFMHDGLVLESAETARERELVIFAQLAPDGLTNMANMATAVEHMEQYQWLYDNTSRGGVKGQVRVRKIVKQDDDPVYILTTKAYDGPGDAMESNAETDSVMFNHVKAMAPSGQIKTRYSVPVQGHELTWEFDVIQDKDGNRIDWVKIDLEIPEGYRLHAMPALPDGLFSRVIDKPRAERSEEEEAILDDLFANRFFIKNLTVPEPDDGDKISKKALAGLLRPYVSPLIGYITAISYNESYFGEREGELKSQLKELEYAWLRLVKGTQAEQNMKNENCDCEENNDAQ